MNVYRITTAEWAGILDGEGAKETGGRWNSVGYPLLYTARYASTALVEVMVHVDLDLMPDDYRLVTIEVPDDAPFRTIRSADFPPDWRSVPEHPWFKATGDVWIQTQDTLSLVVPSAVVPLDSNIMINPMHPDWKRCRVSNVEPFPIDARLK
jgi:RES domain-containing protein